MYHFSPPPPSGWFTKKKREYKGEEVEKRGITEFEGENITFGKEGGGQKYPFSDEYTHLLAI